MNFIKQNKHYKYTDRSCESCLGAESCRAIVGKDWSVAWLDLAKCGCRRYKGNENN